jgi:Peptidase inhibitor I78 family
MRLTIITAAIVAPVLLSACVSGPKPAPEPDGPAYYACDAAPAQAFVGKLSNPDRNMEIQRLTGASTLRWIGPNMAVTMDYREDRVNVYYNADQFVTQISCG